MLRMLVSNPRQLAVMKDFENDINLQKWTTKHFSKAIQAFTKNAPWVYKLNLVSLQISGKQIVRNIDG
jgi:hypothetical protein